MDRRSALAGLGAGLAAASASPAWANDPLHIATVPIDAGAQAYYALDQGFFRDAGIDAQVDAIASGAAVLAGVASGALDIGFSNLISIAVAYKHNVPVTLLAPASLYLAAVPTSVLMVPANSPAKTARDLNGKTFGANGLKTITQYSAQVWMDKNGGDSSTVKFVEMSFPQIIEALGANRIDAAIVADPFIAQAEPGARVFANAYDAIAPRFIIGCFFTTTSWAAAHADLAKRFAQAIARTAQWANTHQPQSALILAKYGKMDPSAAAKMKRVQYAPRFVISEMQPEIDLAAKYGGLTATFPADELVYKLPS
ncbi:MAG TPA: ABC transporter substrate-binding protein [Candidatus Lustribacter sp.]|jgi:NitT/TauT family transport system substrate-binding protein|nr:ABC transporter substrate-binding protein [Candidatus Lustribacter sp.]